MIKLDGTTQFVEYEGLPTICYHCGRYDHLDSSCPLKTQQQQPSMASTSTPREFSGEARTREEQLFGAWMKVPSRVGRPHRNTKKGYESSTSFGDKGNNRFDLFASFDNIDKSKETTSDEGSYKEKETVQIIDTMKSWQKSGNAKSTSSKESNPANTSPKKSVQPQFSLHSIVVSQAYQTIHTPMNLDPTKHSAISLVEPRKGEYGPQTTRHKSLEEGL